MIESVLNNMLSIRIPAPLLPAFYPELCGQSLQLSHSPGLALHPGPSNAVHLLLLCFCLATHFILCPILQFP